MIAALGPLVLATALVAQAPSVPLPAPDVPAPVTTAQAGQPWFSAKIVGGVEAGKGEFPFIVSLRGDYGGYYRVVVFVYNHPSVGGMYEDGKSYMLRDGHLIVTDEAPP